MDHQKAVHFIDRSATRARYLSVEVDTKLIIRSWRAALFSFQWLTPDGAIKAMGDLAPEEQAKRQIVEAAIKNGTPLQKPVLGIGLQDNVEIGSGRAEFLTLTALGYRSLPVHIPKSNMPDFEAFLFKI